MTNTNTVSIDDMIAFSSSTAWAGAEHRTFSGYQLLQRSGNLSMHFDTIMID